MFICLLYLIRIYSVICFAASCWFWFDVLVICFVGGFGLVVWFVFVVWYFMFCFGFVYCDSYCVGCLIVLFDDNGCVSFYDLFSLISLLFCCFVVFAIWFRLIACCIGLVFTDLLLDLVVWLGFCVGGVVYVLFWVVLVCYVVGFCVGCLLWFVVVII